jgi:hypothetical protein
MRTGLTVVTCTGDRPLAFALCVGYVGRQTRKPDQWIVVDDGKTPLDRDARQLEMRCGIGEVRVVRRPPRPDDPDHTLSVNLLAALEVLSHDRVAFVEDDDWYWPGHLAAVDAGLESCDLFGYRGIVYYHVGRRSYRAMGGPASIHSSLCQTAMTRAALPTLERICRADDRGVRGSGFVDLRLWREFDGAKSLVTNHGTVVGIKGLPGRPGLTSGWRTTAGYTPDMSLRFLESLIGPDVRNYR